MEQKKDRMKEETDKPTIIVGYFNISLSTTDRTNRQKVSQNIEDLDDFTNQFDLIDIYRTFHPTIAEYTFFSQVSRTFPKRDHILDHKTSLSEFERIQIVQSMVTD